MTGITLDLPSAAMAKKETGARTAQINFRLKESTIERMERFRDAHPLHPLLTQIVEASVKDWLDAHERDLPPKAKRT